MGFEVFRENRFYVGFIEVLFRPMAVLTEQRPWADLKTGLFIGALLTLYPILSETRDLIRLDLSWTAAVVTIVIFLRFLAFYMFLLVSALIVHRVGMHFGGNAGYAEILWGMNTIGLLYEVFVQAIFYLGTLWQWAYLLLLGCSAISIYLTYMLIRAYHGLPPLKSAQVLLISYVGEILPFLATRGMLALITPIVLIASIIGMGYFSPDNYVVESASALVYDNARSGYTMTLGDGWKAQDNVFKEAFWMQTFVKGDNEKLTVSDRRYKAILGLWDPVPEGQCQNTSDGGTSAYVSYDSARGCETVTVGPRGITITFAGDICGKESLMAYESVNGRKDSYLQAIDSIRCTAGSN
ncbi:MAG: hypothetical protein V1875_01505 [Candidatus Altiarchaeota archaeon]